MKKVIFAAATLLMLAVVFPSCKKEDNSLSDTDKVTAEDLLAHNDITEQLDADVSEALDNATGEADERTDCPAVSFAQPQGTWPNTITLDYSDGGCTNNGRTFKGKVIITQSNPIYVQGATRSFAFDQFFIENAQISGTKTVTNTGLNSSGQPVFTVSVNETVAYPNGTTATYQSERIRSMTEGYGTSTFADNVWTISGTASGVNRNGKAYTSAITTPLVKKALCPWISAGVIELEIEGLTRQLDFGDGTCDRDAILTLANGTEKEIQIRHFWWR